MTSYDSYPASEPDLRPEQLAALEAGPGLVRDSAAAGIFDVAAALQQSNLEYESLGNFSNFFEKQSSLAGMVTHRMSCRRRFSIIYPELTAQLETLVAQGIRTPYPGPSGIVHASFKQAYEKMRQLVDVDDATVRQSDGTIDPSFLLH